MTVNLAKELASPRPLGLRQGVVTAVGASSCTVQIAGSSAVAGVAYMLHARPEVNDTVWLLQNGTDVMVVGKVMGTAGKFVVNSSAASNIVSQGAGAGIELGNRDGAANPWVLYSPNADTLTVWRGADLGYFRYTEQTFEWWGAKIGRASFYGDFACFAHWSKWSAGNYALLQASTGETFLNSGNTLPLNFRINNGNHMVLSPGTGIRLAIKGDNHFGDGDCARVYNDGELWVNSLGVGGDNNHNAGIVNRNGWYRVYGDLGIYWEDYNTGWWCAGGVDMLTTYDHGIMRAARDTHQTGGGGWGTCAVRTEGTSGSGDKGMAWHRSGHYAQAIYLGGDAIMRYVGSDGAWNRQDGNWFNPSSRKIKRDIYDLEPGGLKKVMELRPKKFKYDPKPEDLARFEKEAKQGRWGDAAQLERTKKFRDREYVGFIAEELAEVYPEAVGWDAEGNPSGYKDSILAALMVQAIQELTQRLETLETTAALNKGSNK